MRHVRRLGFLVACFAGACVDEECHDELYTDTPYTPYAITAGNDLVAASWFIGTPGNSPPADLPMYATSLSANGDPSPVVELPRRLGGGGVTGTASVLWHAPQDHQCVTHDENAPPLQFGLVRDGVVQLVDVSAERPTHHSVAFANGGYQVFWLDGDNRLRHRALFEDGTLGPVHDLGVQTGYCIYAVSDLATVHLLIAVTFPLESPVLLVDPTNGSTEPRWTVSARTPIRVFWFAGELHVVSDGPRIQSIDPASGIARMRTPDPGLPNQFEIAVGTDAMFVALYSPELNERQIVELDASFTITERHTMSASGFFEAEIGAIGSDFVFAAKVVRPAPEPEHIDIIRGQKLTGTETWRTTTVSDSPPRSQRVCPVTH